jgi:meiotically up-regulated gene 157 (Mug157) protein
MSVIMRALTSENDNEIADCLAILKKSSAGTGFMHESFYKNDPLKYTREWFGWANSLFGELILKLANERPHLL